jgi:hypothetical protein
MNKYGSNERRCGEKKEGSEIERNRGGVGKESRLGGPSDG